MPTSHPETIRIGSAPEPDPAALIDSRAGWPTVIATFLSTFTVFGVAYSFGAFFKPMADEFGSGRASTSFFFAITTFLYFGIGVFSGRIADRIGPRRVLLVGAVCMVAGLLVMGAVARRRNASSATSMVKSA